MAIAGSARSELRLCRRKAAGSMIMVCGASRKASDWDGQLPFSERYDLLRYEISGDPVSDAQELLGICREAGLRAPHLLGHSLGSKACLGFCSATDGIRNRAYKPQTLALVCPVSIPEGSPAPRVLLIFEKEYASEGLPGAVKAGLSSETAVIIAEGHFPFRENPGWFNGLYARFLGKGSLGDAESKG